MEFPYYATEIKHASIYANDKMANHVYVNFHNVM